MDTPICDFVSQYAQSGKLRLHMPGHKGSAFLGVEPLDITEFDGADNLYEPAGIIAQSEANASRLFGCQTYYSTEGSSQCIRAMLYLVLLYARQQGKRPLIAAGRNVHKTFISAVALLDLDVVWLYPQKTAGYLSCDVRPEELDAYLRYAVEKPAAVYLTSPDYLGNVLDIAALSAVCHAHGVLLVVDNAHGAYLRFLPQSQHPIDLGADVCCDSAHKTLPVLTGGAYLHLADTFPKEIAGQVKSAMALFGSTSPSYLILQSLDQANLYLETYPQRLKAFLPMVGSLKQILGAHGYILYGSEQLKLTIHVSRYGYSGMEFGEHLRRENIVCEFYDRDYLVLMLSPETGEEGVKRLEHVLRGIPRKNPIEEQAPVFCPGERAMSIREAVLSPGEVMPMSACLGRVIAAPTAHCPPAVPILVSGERVDEHALECFQYYGVETCCVVKQAE